MVLFSFKLDNSITLILGKILLKYNYAKIDDTFLILAYLTQRWKKKLNRVLVKIYIRKKVNHPTFVGHFDGYQKKTVQRKANTGR